jgi:hypothetical protein
MTPDYKKLFSSLETPEPPTGLTEKILLRISRRERRVLGVKIAASAVLFGVSASVAIIGFLNLVQDLSQSGFFQIGSLVFSDFSTVMANFPDFAFSIVESFPAFTAAILLSGVLFAIWSMANLVDEAVLMKTDMFGAAQ